jgi:hypothetical protein
MVQPIEQQCPVYSRFEIGSKGFEMNGQSLAFDPAGQAPIPGNPPVAELFRSHVRLAGQLGDGLHRAASLAT